MIHPSFRRYRSPESYLVNWMPLRGHTANYAIALAREVVWLGYLKTYRDNELFGIELTWKEDRHAYCPAGLDQGPATSLETVLHTPSARPPPAEALRTNKSLDRL